MPRCRSPPFLSEKQIDKKEMEENMQIKIIKVNLPFFFGLFCL